MKHCIKKLLINFHKMSIIDNWLQKQMMICDSSASEKAKQLHMIN